MKAERVQQQHEQHLLILMIVAYNIFFHKKYHADFRYAFSCCIKQFERKLAVHCHCD